MLGVQDGSPGGALDSEGSEEGTGTDGFLLGYTDVVGEGSSFDIFRREETFPQCHTDALRYLLS